MAPWIFYVIYGVVSVLSTLYIAIHYEREYYKLKDPDHISLGHLVIAVFLIPQILIYLLFAYKPFKKRIR